MQQNQNANGAIEVFQTKKKEKREKRDRSTFWKLLIEHRGIEQEEKLQLLRAKTAPSWKKVEG